jgi:hypothetical protein
MTISAQDVLEVVGNVTKEWTKQRKAEERGRARCSRAYMYSDRVYFTEVADRILPEAYEHASGGGRYTVSKRQLYYACREKFKLLTTRDLEYPYFAGTLLVKYLNRRRPGWKITADPRGTLRIPNAGYALRIPCGTVHIDNYLRDAGKAVKPFADVKSFKFPVGWPSVAAGQRYRAVLYIEKEGFDPLLEEAQIAERFDLAVLSCKGMSVVAARKLVDTVCYRGGGVPLLTAHDFDKSGFEIAQRLVSVSREAELAERVTYEFQNAIDVIDLGLNLADVEKYDLQHETCDFNGSFADDSLATPEEQEFLRSGLRVELNAFTSPQFVEWLEAKLVKHLGEGRLVPKQDVLADAYRRALAVARINRELHRVRTRAVTHALSAAVPEGLAATLGRRMKESSRPWDWELYELAVETLGEAGGAGEEE